jgi:hypothetical protein
MWKIGLFYLPCEQCVGLSAQVSFTGDAPHIAAQKTNLQYLLELDVDNMIWNFRQVANLKAPGHPYGGWESPQSELRGHFVGQWLSSITNFQVWNYYVICSSKLHLVVYAMIMSQYSYHSYKAFV